MMILPSALPARERTGVPGLLPASVSQAQRKPHSHAATGVLRLGSTLARVHS
jgi:hypothetical protein